ncbi:long-chain fatty acid--CoA ligase [Streptomyces dangxiongensis]|uniref:Long-chain fatty acid--CoA ligase n=1 Tax=Streptomyces dangxiongensis TaxID=1442032 RepID=A0A3G2JDQ5_9ACTN|nr:long-chain fatty acid--CoA ligase [Streptomyces dangxiongensis]AYN38652.1 long-chain fatty acid--CoA ligase [Streptomyces dangxiongensis]
MTRPLAAVLADTAARRPDAPAVIFEDTPVPYGLLWERARSYAAEMRRHGIGPGDRVGLLLPNTPHFPVAYYGTLALGATVVPMSTQLRSGEIEFVLADSGARALVCAAPTLDEGAKAAATAGATLFTVGVDDTDGVRLDPPEPAPPVAGYFPSSPDDIAAILYTSGTTGRPKGAMLSHRNIVTNIEVTAVSPFDVRPDDVLLCSLPLSHTFGQTCVMSVAFHAGATVVLMPRFTAPDALALMSRYGCTVFMGVPTMYHALLEAVPDGTPAPRLHRAYSGGSALAVPVLDRVQETFGCQVYEGYGLTETSPCVAYNQPGQVTRPGTVGTPIAGVEVGITRAGLEDRIELLPAGEVGEVVIRGHNVMSGYLGLPEATAAVLVGGWFRSGDLGVLEADGCLRLVDRKKDIVLRGGYNVYPREVEEALLRHPAVEQTAVIGIPDDRLGEEICAVVVTRPEFTQGPALAADIVAWSRDRLAGYKYPRRVEFTRALPTGHSGKVLKRLLVQRYA